MLVVEASDPKPAFRTVPFDEKRQPAFVVVDAGVEDRRPIDLVDPLFGKLLGKKALGWVETLTDRPQWLEAVERSELRLLLRYLVLNWARGQLAPLPETDGTTLCPIELTSN
jgi:hypothetical protein